MSKGNGWVPIDKMLAQDFKYIKRPLSRIEAMFSYTVDVDNGITGTIAGYATQWGWSRNKVRRFVNCIGTEEGHLKDSRRTAEGHPIRFIDNGLWIKKDSKETEEGQKRDRRRDATIEPNPKPKELYTSEFESFWLAYPKKVGKGGAYTTYKNIKQPKPSLSTLLDSIQAHQKTDQWQNKQFIPHAQTWLNQRRWEDEISTPLNGTPRKTPEQIEAEKREALS